MSDTAGTLRRSLVVLAALGVVGTAVELAMLRHWNGLVQSIPWFALGFASIAVVVLAVRPTARRVETARILALIVLVAAGVGIYEHVVANYHAGPLDFRYSAKWDTMSTTSKWWAAITESVGPSPPLAPLVLAWTSLCVIFATIAHPAKAVTVRG